MPVLGYDVAPEGGRLLINAAEAERVREIFALCARSAKMMEVLREVHARGWTAKPWTSRAGREHGGQLLSMSTLRLLITNVGAKFDGGFRTYRHGGGCKKPTPVGEGTRCRTVLTV
jgi:hypothetical protein